MNNRRGGTPFLLVQGGVIALAVGVGWCWRAVPVYQACRDVEQIVQALESASGRGGRDEGADQLRREDAVGNPAQTFLTHESNHSPVADDDVSALVRWQALLQHRQLEGWQGQSVSSSSATSASNPGGHLVWRLEGPAAYEQGLSMLEALARNFPRLVLLQVQVQKIASSGLLHWRLELHWSSPLPSVALRWSPGIEQREPLARGVNPFEATRVRAAVPDLPDSSPVGADTPHVLPRAPLQEIRLVGVMGTSSERYALIAWSASATPSSGRDTGRLTTHQVRAGQILGLEQTRVIAIDADSMVLRGSHAGTGGRPGKRHQVLSMAAVSADAQKAGGTHQ